MGFLRNNLLIIAGLILGAIAGYWSYSTCDGACVIRSNPFISISHGILTGGLVASLIKTAIHQTK